jgi:transcriptional regulator with GAF, ATPase, and Fis domain
MPEKIAPPPSTEGESARYRDLSEIAVSLTSTFDLKAILDAIVDGIIRVTNCERGFVMLHEKDGTFAMFTGRSQGTPWEESSAREISHTVLRRVVETYQPYIAGDVAQIDDLREQRSIIAEKIRSVVVLPLIDREQLIGVIYADSSFVIPVFNEGDRAMLRAFSAQAAVAINRARQHGEILDRGDQLEEQNRQLRAQLGQHVTMSNMVIRNKLMLDLFSKVDKIARGNMSSVLIHGESGTGKELLSRAIHTRGPRHNGPFVGFNAAALTPTLIESSLFGHRKGAFTGADFDKPGYFEVANGGTLFLDEIGDMPLELQTRLLRALQEKEIERMGEEGRPRKVDVNVVAATNKDLLRAVQEGKFRGDLYYRLNAAELFVPPLRERREDILPLAEYFLKKFAAERGQPLPNLSRDARAFLAGHAWPGNVRELENMMEWALAFQDENGLVSADALKSKATSQSSQPPPVTDADGSLRQLMERYEERIVRDALARNDNNVSATAKSLGLSRQMLHEKIKKYGIVTRES